MARDRGSFYSGVDPNAGLGRTMPAALNARPAAAQNPFLSAPAASQGGQTYNPLLDPTGGFARSTKIGGLISGLFGNGMTRQEFQQQQANSLTAQAMQAIIPIAQQVGAQPAILKLIESDIGQQMMTQGADFDAIASVANLAASGKVREARARAFGQAQAPQITAQPAAVEGDQWAGMRAAGEALPSGPAIPGLKTPGGHPVTPAVVQEVRKQTPDWYAETAHMLLAAGDTEGADQALKMADLALKIEAERKPPTTDDLKEYNFYVQQREAAGAEAMSFFAYQLAQKKAGSPSQNINTYFNQPPVETELMKSLGKGTGEQLVAIQTQGRKAAELRSDLDALDFLIEIAPQKPGVAFTFSIPQTGARFPGLGAFTEAGQAFNSIVKRITPTLRVEGSGATSDLEIRMFEDSLPSLGNHLDANRYILAVLRAKAAIDLERAGIANMIATGEIKPFEGLKRLNAVNAKSIMADPAVQDALLKLDSYQPKFPATTGQQIEVRPAPENPFYPLR
ncbi:hypothetical protein QM996_01115 [Sinorhizobium chiapasense]